MVVAANYCYETSDFASDPGDVSKLAIDSGTTRDNEKVLPPAVIHPTQAITQPRDFVSRPPPLLLLPSLSFAAPAFSLT